MAAPAGPAAENHTDRIESRPKTTRPIPIASRTHGERICRVGVLALPFFFDDGEGRWAEALRVVFATYTSMITGRITGLRCVTS